eukprot:37585_1
MSNSNCRKTAVDYNTKHIPLKINTSIIEYEINGISTPPNTPTSTLSTPSSPLTPSLPILKLDDNSTYSVEQTLKYHQYTPISKITKTLQGSIWQVSKNETVYIVKVTNKLLHKHHVTNYNGKQIHISENVISEATIVKYLTNFHPPKSLVKYVDFFSDEFNYMFVMQYGGEMSLFEFVKRCHQYIDQGIISIKEWQKFCKIAMSQMVQLVDWLHSKMSCCHLDISLENFVIDNAMVMEISKTKTIKILPDFQIRIIDFGVAEVFYTKNASNKIDFWCQKFVGKRQYKAPEVYQKERFDARKADIWSLAVVFFIMVIGCPPFRKPWMNDITFNLIINGHLGEVITGWNKCQMITPNIFNLLTLLFKEKKHRLTIKDIKRHPFLL